MTPERLRGRLLGAGLVPAWGIVLGSGFDDWLKRLTNTSAPVPFAEAAGLRPATTAGHAGRFVGGWVEDVPVAVCDGRLHLYEGLSAAEVVAPVLALVGMGASSILLTTAVGSVRADLAPGDAVAVTDQINLTGQDPHTGRGFFPDAARLYDAGYARKLAAAGLKEGVLAGVRGPSFETRAEVAALRAMGADMVCMSTVLETLAAAGSGARCAGVALVANEAGSAGVTHEEVVETVRAAAAHAWEKVRTLILSPDG
ncbi:MAG: purine-nucleoside phosphorylase [bacterium]|nr:MAG: purine-nucleoside phosphorylase [bacterium]